MSEPMQIKIGAPATGSDFFPRDNIVNNLLNALRVEHVLFLAPHWQNQRGAALERNRPGTVRVHQLGKMQPP